MLTSLVDILPSALHGSRSQRDMDGAAACGPPRSGVVAPMRRCTTHSMRPLRAAVAWSGVGMRWRRGRLGRPTPRAPFCPSMDIPCVLIMIYCAYGHWRHRSRLSLRAPSMTTCSSPISADGPGVTWSEEVRRCHGADLGRRRIGTPLSQACLLFVVMMSVLCRWEESRTYSFAQMRPSPLRDDAAMPGSRWLAVVAPMRRYTLHSMRPSRAAVVWHGLGMRWPHGRPMDLAPQVTPTGYSASRRCYRAVAAARHGIGGTCSCWRPASAQSEE